MTESFKAILSAFTQYLQTLGFATSTCYDYTRFVFSFLSYAEQKGITQIKGISTPFVFEYFAYLEQKRGDRTRQTFSTSHLNRNFLALDKFLEFLHHNGVPHAPSPTHYLLENTRKKPLQVLTPQEIQTLYNAIPLTFLNMTFAAREPRQRALQLMLDLCYGCGLRKSEALSLKTSDIDFERKTIHVKQGKNYKDRLVPMSKKVSENLQLFVYQHRKHFSQRNTFVFPFAANALCNSLEILLNHCNDEKIKNKKPSLHTLRHSIATHLLQNGMSIENIALFLGHSSLESTQIYTHILHEL